MMNWDTSTMMGQYGSSMMAVGWVTYLVALVLMILGIIALIKYISKN